MHYAIFFLIFLVVTPVSAGPRLELSETVPSGRLETKDFKAYLGMHLRRIEGTILDVPVLTVQENDRTQLEIIGEASGFDFPDGSAELLQVDPENEVAEVVFKSYTGGAHCCTAVRIADKVGRRWYAVDLGLWDGEGGSFDDLDGDGTFEFFAADNNFLYAFDCYACSEAPLVIKTIRGGEVLDVSSERRFLATHKAWLSAMEARLKESGGEKGPGYWAGWIAAKARIGEGRRAFATFRKQYRPQPGEDEFSICAVDVPECPDDQWTAMSLERALRVFLPRHGYKIE
jgi:hypothetical protein